MLTDTEKRRKKPLHFWDPERTDIKGTVCGKDPSKRNLNATGSLEIWDRHPGHACRTCSEYRQALRSKHAERR